MPKMTSDIGIIWVTGPWSSGSTALTGWLARLGAYGCPPYQKTNDLRTPNSFESKALRDKLCEHRNELTLLANPNKSDNELKIWFADWCAKQASIAKKKGAKCLVLKHPILAFYIEILRREQDEILLITRHLRDIENTRKRRSWHEIYGKAGAKKIYSSLFNTFLQKGIPYTAIPYSQFLQTRAYRIELARRLNLDLNAKRWEEAENWINREP